MEVNSGRVEKRDVIIPVLQNLFKTYTKVELMEKLEKTGLPFAPINAPEDLFNDPHLNVSGGLLDIDIPDGGSTKLPAMPIEMNDRRFGVHHQAPRVGEHSHEILRELGFDELVIESLYKKKILS